MKGKSRVYGNNSSNKLSAEWLQGEEAACLAVTHSDLTWAMLLVTGLWQNPEESSRCNESLLKQVFKKKGEPLGWCQIWGDGAVRRAKQRTWLCAIPCTPAVSKAVEPETK